MSRVEADRAIGALVPMWDSQAFGYRSWPGYSDLVHPTPSGYVGNCL